MPHKQFEIWLRRQLFEGAEPCTKLIVRHGKATSRLGQVLIRLEVPKHSDGEVVDNDAWSDWIRSVVNEIDMTTQADADGSSSGVEQYVIQSFHGDDSVKPTGSFNIRVASESGDSDDDGILSEPATKNGLLSQLMRHNEANMRSTIMLAAQMSQTAQKQLTKQEQIIDKLIEDRFNNFVVMEKLLSEQHSRDTETAEAAHRMEIKDKVLDTFRMVLPAAANKLLGKGTVVEEISATEQQILALSQSLTEDQFGLLQKTLTEPQLMVLLGLISSANEKANKQLGAPKSNEVND